MPMDQKLRNKEYFQLGSGGLLYQFYLKAGIIKSDPPAIDHKKIFLICLFTWLPLFILSFYHGYVIKNVELPFLYDFGVHVRFFLSLALLIYTDIITQKRIIIILKHFMKCHIIATDEIEKFKSIIAKSARLTSFIGAEIFLVIIILISAIWFSRLYTSYQISTWYLPIVDDVRKLSPAGYWYAYISLPIFQFVLLRWYYRILIWYQFLWQVSKLNLQINSLHPDRSGGLGFLSTSLFAFQPALLAHSVLFAGVIFTHIWNAGDLITKYQAEIICLFVFLIILPLAPLLFFSKILLKEKRRGTLEYSAVAMRYVNYFRAKWIYHTSDNKEQILGTGDIQSLADLFNSFSVSSQMRMIPFGRGSIVAIVILVGLPFIPVLLTILPMEQLIAKTIGLVF